MTNELVSVIIPAYNHEKYVQETIGSIIKQTYENIELILIDDGSTDSTWKKVQELKEECEKRFKNIHFETKSNSGTCETLNKLLSLASGEYVYFIASDDVAKPNAIEELAKTLHDDDGCVLAVGDNEFIDGNSNRIGWGRNQESVPLSRARYKTFGEMLQKKYADIPFKSTRFGKYETFMRHNYIPNGYLVRRTALDKIGGFIKDAPLEDLYLHLQLSKLGTYRYTDKILFSYRWHDNNTAKKREYMREISRKTLKYEQKLVNSSSDTKWRELFNQGITRKRIKFCIWPIISLYSIKNMEEKRLILKVFLKEFVLSRKKYSE